MIVHIVPTVPPDINGLADYCYKLWEYWPQPRPEWKCLAMHIPGGAVEAWPEVEIIPFESSRSGLCKALEQAQADTVVLHYVGYAYHSKGAPVWLPGALRAWKKQSQGRLCVMFHELWPRGHLKQSAFWLSPLTRRIVVELAKLADKWVVSSIEAQRQLLSTNSEASKGSLIPVGANIEPWHEVSLDKPWPLSAGQRLKLVLFGLPSTRLAALQKNRHLISLLIERGLVESIALIGQVAPTSVQATVDKTIAIIGRPELWLQRYGLSIQQISEEFFRADVGIVSHRPGLLTKSGVYATFCLHGLISISAFEAGSSAEAIVPALINFDDHPERCANQLGDSDQMNLLVQQTRETAQNTLSWMHIAKEFSTLTI